MNYIKLFAILFILLICANSSNAVEIVYPKTTTIKIDSPVTFFIGNEKPDKKLTINGEEVKIHPTGGFYHVVKLSDGENIFSISNGNPSEQKTYTIIKSNLNNSTKSEKYIEYNNSKVYALKADNVPLRAFPDESGDGRLQNLQKDIKLNVIGEQGGYYKVKLARDDFAWISKKYVYELKDCADNLSNIISYEYEEDSTHRVFTIKLDKKVPYILSESRYFKLINNNYEPAANGLDLVIYNVKNMPDNKYEFHINNQTNLFGYKVKYNDANELIISVKKQPKISHSYPLKDIVVTIDPGHGGDEYGAIGCLGDKEKDLNLKFAIETKKQLEKVGAKVYLTRDNDSQLGLYERVKYSQDKNSDIFISIHLNALPDNLAQSYKSGTGVYYFFPQSNNLARTILTTMTKELSMNNDKVNRQSFAVIRNTESLAVLIEIGYIINPEDNAKLINPEFPKKTARTITRALEKYFNELQ